MTHLPMYESPPIRTSQRRANPDDSVVPPKSVRAREALILISLAMPVMLMLLYENSGRTHEIKLLAEDTHQLRRTALAWAFGGALTAIGICAAIAWKFSTVVATVLLAAFLPFGGAVTTERLKKLPYNNYNEQPLSRIRIQLPDQIAGADLAVNGVTVGKIPYEAAPAEFFQQFPAGDSLYSRQSWRDALFEWDHVINSDRRKHLPWGSVGLNTSRMSRELARRSPVFVHVELNGMQGFTAQSFETATRDGVRIYTLNTKFKEWEAELDILMNRVRLNDYKPSREWFDAITSYESWGWNRLLDVRKFEPEVQPLIDGWVRHVHQLDDVRSTRQAWDKLMQLSDQAVADQDYDSESCLGRAVDLVVPKLDPQQLINEVLRVTNEDHFPPDYASPGRSRGKLWMSVPSSTLTDQSHGWRPVFQAVWRLDEILDRKDPDTDNIVELQVTPAMLSRVYDSRRALDYAEALGGSAFDTFLLRQDWNADPKDADFREAFGGPGDVLLNGWYAKLLKLDSPAGRQFRRDHRERLLKTARESGVNLTTSSIEERIGFLFMERDFTPTSPSVAMQFWPDFDRMLAATAGANDSNALVARWNYLGRLWPESTIDLFVETFPTEPERVTLYGALPDSIPTIDRFRILSAVENMLQQKLLTMKEVPSSDRHALYNKIKNAIHTVRWRQKDVPDPEAAPVFLEMYAGHGDSDRIKAVTERMENDRVHHGLVELAANHENVEYRRLALVAIRHHPVARRVRLLEQLKNDRDPAVAVAAINLAQELKDLTTAPLPFRRLSKAEH